MLFYCQKSGKEPDACKKRYQDPYLYLLPFKAEQYTSGRAQNVGCVYYCCCSYYAAARYTWKSGLAVVDFD